MNLPDASVLTLDTPLGSLLAITSGEALAGLYFVDQADLPNVRGLPKARAHANLTRLRNQLKAYFAGEPVVFDIPLVPRGTRFQQAVWRALQAIPHGQAVTYGAVACQVGSPQGMRAVGQAVGRNPWIIVVPCHRVLAAGGALGGFSSGLARKRALLQLEGLRWREPVRPSN